VERNFTAERSDQLWLADITYLRTFAGFCHVALAIDAMWNKALQGLFIGCTEQERVDCGAVARGLRLPWRREPLPHAAGLRADPRRGARAALRGDRIGKRTPGEQ